VLFVKGIQTPSALKARDSSAQGNALGHQKADKRFAPLFKKRRQKNRGHRRSVA